MDQRMKDAIVIANKRATADDYELRAKRLRDEANAIACRYPVSYKVSINAKGYVTGFQMKAGSITATG